MNENCFNLSGSGSESRHLDRLTADTQWGTRFHVDHAPVRLRRRFRRWLGRGGRDDLRVLAALVLFALSLAMVL